ncbi:hypothetical protein EYF80_038140 [Liparis tanakae]|uniref:Uncharacterized protein n=1 Tax=Liparis tanakae TaxID=230148 RepID=A0A4Z2GEG4_9TELE|nr:hypothetical protein EYF80_038140 [Liparis tanakae]
MEPTLSDRDPLTYESPRLREDQRLQLWRGSARGLLRPRRRQQAGEVTEVVELSTELMRLERALATSPSAAELHVFHSRLSHSLQQEEGALWRRARRKPTGGYSGSPPSDRTGPQA